MINDLDRTNGEDRDDVGLQTAIMSFINAALRYGPGQVGNQNFEIAQAIEFNISEDPR